jgi:hypothetical protein
MFGSGQAPKAGSREHGSESSDFIKDGEIFWPAEQLLASQKDSTT